LALASLALAAAIAVLVAPAGASAATVTFSTVDVSAPGNPSVGIVPFSDAIYQSCSDAPSGKGPACQMVGGVDYRYGIGRLETTVAQWVAFLNVADPTGSDPHRLYDSSESGTAWPKFGQINESPSASKGRHYSVAYPQWADKPYGFANFLRAARYINSLDNGRVVSKRAGVVRGIPILTYKVKLSSQTERGMYDMANPKTVRTGKSGFVLPSQDEWIKAAYYDRTGGGTFSYWKYPTNPGVFGDNTATARARRRSTPRPAT